MGVPAVGNMGVPVVSRAFIGGTGDEAETRTIAGCDRIPACLVGSLGFIIVSVCGQARQCQSADLGK